MSRYKKLIVMLMADDDPEDRALIDRASRKRGLISAPRFVVNGEELIDYLYHRGKYSDPKDSPRPDLILLDLKMPKKDGREALREIKSDPNLRQIPIVVLTNSEAEEDIFSSYDLGASSYIVKPETFSKLVELVETMERYWFELVKLPCPSPENG